MKKLDDDRVKQLLSAGLTKIVIARRLGVTQGAIYYAIRRLKARKNTSDQPAPAAARAEA